jgi:hypothetical protein
MNKHDMADLIDGMEHNILKAWKVSDSEFNDYATQMKINVNNITETQRKAVANAFVLEHANEKGMYGLAGRWPVIDKGTIQYSKFEIDNHVAPRSAVVTPGSAWRFSMDFDGDNFGSWLSAYKDHKNAALNHEYAKGAFEIESDASASVINRVMKDVLDGLSSEEAKSITVGELSSKRTIALAKATELFESKMRDRSDVLTQLARTGKLKIGTMDNLGRGLESRHYSLTRDVELAELAGASPEQAGRISQEYSLRRAAVEEISRAISQDSIASKHTSTEDFNLHIERLNELERELRSPFMNIEKAESLFQDLGIYKFGDAISTIESYQHANGRVEAVQMKESKVVRMGLLEIKKTNRVNAETGSSSIGDSVGHSLGTSPGNLRMGLQSQTESMPLMMQYVNAGADDVPFNDAIALRQKAKVNAYSKLENIGEIASEILNESRSPVFSEPVPNASLSKGVSSAADNIMTQIAHIANNSHVAEGGGIGGKLGGIGLLFSSFALGTVAGASAPTPEGLQDMTVIQGKPQSQPTARIAIGPKNPQVTLKVSATSNRGHDPNDVASLVHHSVQEMSGLQMNQTVNVTDNSQNINQQWLQGIVANAMNSGYAR